VPRECLLHTGSEVWGLGRGKRFEFSNFQVKNAGFYAFYCENLLVTRNRYRRGRGLIAPLGAEDIECRGITKFSKRTRLPQPQSARTLRPRRLDDLSACLNLHLCSFCVNYMLIYASHNLAITIVISVYFAQSSTVNCP